MLKNSKRKGNDFYKEEDKIMEKLTAAILILYLLVNLGSGRTLAQQNQSQNTNKQTNKTKNEIDKFSSTYPQLKLNSKKDKILILAPHCDDELLSCGGIIQEALSKDIDVKVVFLTNGDGYRWGAIRNFLRPFVSAKRYVQFGELRQQEAIESLKTLGLPQKDIYFLGYPDRGLQFLWGDYWHDENIYLSQYTGVLKNPYSLSYKPNRPYTGKNLVEDLTEIILKHKPTKVFVSSPFDEHADHWVTYNFLHYTLAKIKLDNKLQYSPNIYQYLTHRGKWPAANGKSIFPPDALNNDIEEWIDFQLNKEQIEIKEKALKEYKSQVKVTKKYLFSFIKNNEIFIKDNKGQLNITENKTKTAKLTSQNPSYEYKEPFEDTKKRKRFPGGDIKQGEINLNKDELSLKMIMNKKYSHKYKFKINLYLLANQEKETKRFTFNFKITPAKNKNRASINIAPFQSNKVSFDQVEIKRDGNIIKIKLKLPILTTSNYIFFNAESYFKNKFIDRTSWKVIEIESNS